MPIYRVEAPDVSREDRWNPQVLRMIIAHFINRYFGGQKKKTLGELKTHRERKTNNNDGSVIKRQKLDLILSDEAWIEYRHLEAFAHKAGIPTYVLLAFSRAYSDKADTRVATNATTVADLEKVKERAEEARRNLARMIAFSNAMKGLIENSTDEIGDIDDWIEAFKNIKPKL